MNGFFQYFGVKWHLLEFHLNKTILNNSAYVTPKTITPEIAIQKGIQAFYDITFYSIIISIPLSVLYSTGTKEIQ